MLFDVDVVVLTSQDVSIYEQAVDVVFGSKGKSNVVTKLVQVINHPTLEQKSHIHIEKKHDISCC